MYEHRCLLSNDETKSQTCALNNVNNSTAVCSSEVLRIYNFELQMLNSISCQVHISPQQTAGQRLELFLLSSSHFSQCRSLSSTNSIIKLTPHTHTHTPFTLTFQAKKVIIHEGKGAWSCYGANKPSGFTGCGQFSYKGHSLSAGGYHTEIPPIKIPSACNRCCGSPSQHWLVGGKKPAGIFSSQLSPSTLSTTGRAGPHIILSAVILNQPEPFGT